MADTTRKTRLARLRRKKDVDREVEFYTKQERRIRILEKQAWLEAKWLPRIPMVRKVNVENYLNRYNGMDPDYAIDVLVGSIDIKDQFRQEMFLRRREEAVRLRQEYVYSVGFYDPTWGVPMHTPSETDKRKGRRMDKDKEKGKDATDREKPEKGDKATARSEKHGNVEPPTQPFIHRVRIQSLPVLAYLTDFMNTPKHWSEPRSFLRPFKVLIYYQPQMKAALAELEKRHGGISQDTKVPSSAMQPSKPELDATSKLPSDNQSQVAGEEGGAKKKETGGGNVSSEKDDDRPDDDAASVDSDDLDDMESIASDDGFPDIAKERSDALADMRCYVDFVDREIIPLRDRFNGTEQLKVMFDDLWLLFRVGGFVYMPCTRVVTERYHELWRVYRISTPGATNDLQSDWANDELAGTNSQRVFTLYCYYIDYDGTEYGAVRHKFSIKQYEGERDIDSLEAYPLHYRDRDGTLLAALTRQGALFQSYIRDPHQVYNAWTLTRNPPGNFNADDEIVMSRHPQFVESHVIVDFTEACQENPNIRPVFHRPSSYKSSTNSVDFEQIHIQQWTDRLRTKRLYKVQEAVQVFDSVWAQERNAMILQDAFLGQRTKDGAVSYTGNGAWRGGSTKFAATADALTDDQRALLPRRMFAYALRERTFVLVDLHNLKPVFRDSSIFDNLKIRSEHKDMVRGLVASHFQRKQVERQLAEVGGSSERNFGILGEGVTGQDLIQGKGRGLVILLHGVPGVGKTATAEAVASTYEKPLFVITCGDLGLTPNEVESSLAKIFRLAHLWDCVLLLDEADVFLTQRSRVDISRNALVSVFLRILEYYNGLLFLTTNRVGTIDEAFKSRIHMFLYYPPLKPIQIKEIFKLNIDKLDQIEAQRHAVTGHPQLIIQREDIMEFALHHAKKAATPTMLANGQVIRSPCWNGRQIRNAFQVATGLAHYHYSKAVLAAVKAKEPPPSAPILHRKLFESVEQVTEHFEKYMYETRGWDDADLAFFYGERYDFNQNALPTQQHSQGAGQFGMGGMGGGNPATMMGGGFPANYGYGQMGMSGVNNGMGSGMSGGMRPGFDPRTMDMMGAGMGFGTGMGMSTGMGSGMGSGMGAGMNTGMNTGMRSWINPGMNTAMNTGMNTEMNVGMNVGSNTGTNTGMTTGMNNGMGSGMGSGMNAGLNTGMGNMTHTFTSGMAGDMFKGKTAEGGQ